MNNTLYDVVKVFCYVIAGIIILFDLFVYNKSGGTISVSYVMYTETCKRPFIALCLGYVLGHIFWPIFNRSGSWF